MAQERSVDIVRLLALYANRNFALYATGNGISLIGTWAQRLSVGWLTWELTQSGFWLGVVVFADLFPTIIIAPLAGAMADRMDRLKALQLYQAIGALIALMLAMSVWLGAATIWIILGLTLALGIVEALGHPVRLSLVHALVARDRLGPAVAFNAILFNIARFIGPALAGILIVSAGVAFAFIVNALSFAAFLIALQMLRLEAPQAGNKQTNVFTDIVEGLRYTAKHPTIPLLILIMTASGFLARPVIDLLPGFAATIYHVGAGGLSAMTSSVAAGALIGGVLLGSLTNSARLVNVVGISACGMAAAALILTLTTQFWLALPVLMIVGFFNVGTFIASQTVIQLTCDEHMRGRVLSVYGMVFRGAPAAGALLMGVAAEFFGFRIPVAIGCLLVIAIAVPLWRKLVIRVAEAAPEGSSAMGERR